MGWRFRKTFKVMPGVRLNLSRHGVSATFGKGPFSINVGPKGVYQNVNIPGTGISYRGRVPGPSSPTPGTQAHSLDRPAASTLPVAQPELSPPTPHEIHSASTELLTSGGLEELRAILADAFHERDTLTKEISTASLEANTATHRYQNWERGFLLKRAFRVAFARRKEAAETATAKLSELQEQLRLTVVATEISIEDDQAEPYYRMRDAFASLSECQKIWNVLAEEKIDRVAHRSKADTLVTRDPVSFSLDSCDLIKWEQNIPHLRNRTGGDMYLYPGFTLYRASRQAFALIDFREMDLTYAPSQFTERERIPSDSEVIGKTWAKCNKDGTPDRRFHGNHQIPIAKYGSLLFTSRDGLDVRYMCSNARLAEQFVKAWRVFATSFQAPANDTEPVKDHTQAKSEAVQRIKTALQNISKASGNFSESIRAHAAHLPTGSRLEIPKADVDAYIRAATDLMEAGKAYAEILEPTAFAQEKATFQVAIKTFEEARSSFEHSLSRGTINQQTGTAYASSMSTFFTAITEFVRNTTPHAATAHPGSVSLGFDSGVTPDQRDVLGWDKIHWGISFSEVSALKPCGTDKSAADYWDCKGIVLS